MIKVENLYKYYGKNIVLENLSFVLPSKGLVAITGESGAGKTTLLNILAFEDEKYTGSIKINEKIVDDKRKFKQNNIFYNKYTNNLIEKLTALNNLKLFLDDDELNLAYKYIERYELEYLLDTNVELLSSGEKQKVSLILAFSRTANITILDEPFGNIDYQSVKLIEEDLNSLKEKSLIIFVTHIEEKIKLNADYIYLLEDNKLKSIKEIPNEENQIEIIDRNKRKVLRFFSSSKNWSKTIFKSRIIIFSVFTYIVLILFLLTIYLINWSNYDFYSDELKNAPVELITFNEEMNLNYSCVEEIKFIDLLNQPEDPNPSANYSSIADPHGWGLHNYLTTPTSGLFNVYYLGICDGLYLEGKYIELGLDDIIITDYGADFVKVDVNDQVQCLADECLFNVKGIVNTNYLKYKYDEEYIKGRPLDYSYVIVSSKFIEKMEEEARKYVFAADITFENPYFRKNYVYNYKYLADSVDFTMNNQMYGNYLYNDNEFIANLHFFHNYIEPIPGYDQQDDDTIGLGYDYINSVKGQKYTINFRIRGQVISKELVCRGASVQQSIIISENVFNELIQEGQVVDYYRDHPLYEVMYKLNRNDKSYKDFIRSIGSRSDYSYVDMGSYDDLYLAYTEKNSYLTIAIVIEMVIFVALIFTYYFFIFKDEYKNYTILSTKGYSLRYYLILNYFYRFLIHLLILGIIFGLYGTLLLTLM